MNFQGLDISVRNTPKYDPDFIPFARFMQAYRAAVDGFAKKKPVKIALERENGQISVYDTAVFGDCRHGEVDRLYMERLCKALLWMRGGFRFTICGAPTLAKYIKEQYAPGGLRAFDADFMAGVYEHKFEVKSAKYEDAPAPHELSKTVGRHLNGCRIGFDAGGSDRKVSAVVDGEAIFSEEVVWHPKTTADPEYHYQGILSAFKSAAEKMPRVDAIGVSSAGIYVANRTMVASLFIKVPRDEFDAKVKDIYIRAAKEIGDVPLEVANDGDVTALAGAMDLDDNCVLGIAMGTSEAGGYVDAQGNITGWLNELAFVPVDLNPGAMVDEWSGDYGCGVKYFSQDCAIKLAPAAGVELAPDATPAEKLKAVQKLMLENDERARGIYESIGCYLASGLALYNEFYDMKHVLLMGRVVSGEGGNIILAEAQRILREDYPEVADKLQLHLPDENSRRVGQSVAAASLPEA